MAESGKRHWTIHSSCSRCFRGHHSRVCCTEKMKPAQKNADHGAVRQRRNPGSCLDDSRGGRCQRAECDGYDD